MSPEELPITAERRSALFTREAVELIDDGVTVVAAFSDPSLRSQITRAWGPELLAPDGPLRICVEADGSDRFASLIEGAPIAINFTQPSTYRSIQAKGVIIALADPHTEQLQRVDEHWLGFAAEAQLVGVSPRLVSRLIDRDSLVSLTIAVDEVFDQTPGPRAGVRL